MRCLHTINQPPSAHALWRDCQQALAPGDTLLLIENGVLALQPTPPDIPAGVQLAALQIDLIRYGLPATAETFHVVDDEGFVALVCQHDKTMSWF